jgi:hypothetical protein
MIEVNLNAEPLGIGAAIAQTAGAIGYYDTQPPHRQWELLEGARKVRSHGEMLDYVRSWVE